MGSTYMSRVHKSDELVDDSLLLSQFGKIDIDVSYGQLPTHDPYAPICFG